MSDNLKTLTSSNYPTVQHFFAETSHVSYLPKSTKGCAGFVLFSVDLELFAKIKKDLVSRNSLFALLLIT